jgi:hypothetical protein
LVYGPDQHEVETIRDQLQTAPLDIYKWQLAEGPPEDLA